MSAPMERLQILVTPEQRRRLQAVARERGEPVTSLVREAIDESFPPAVDAAARRAAARRILDRPLGPPISLAELDAVLDGRDDLPG
jgi:predicted DNA-binding protein